MNNLVILYQSYCYHYLLHCIVSNNFIIYLIFSHLVDDDSSRPSSSVPVSSDIPDIITMPSRFEKKQESGFIDVWWLYDDGGQCLVVVIVSICYLLI